MSKPTPAATAARSRTKDLAEIHIARKQLGLCDDTYRAMLWAQARVHSSKDLDHAGRAKVLAHMRASGFKRRFARPAPAPSAKAPMLAKIDAMLAEAKRPLAYADGMAQHMFGVAKCVWLEADQLHKLLAALVYDQRRRAKPGKPASDATPTTNRSAA